MIDRPYIKIGPRQILLKKQAARMLNQAKEGGKLTTYSFWPKENLGPKTTQDQKLIMFRQKKTLV
jgi:hypothetical protein